MDNKLTITIKIEYEPETLTHPDILEDLSYCLEKDLEYHIENGLLRGALGAKVAKYSIDVTLPEASLGAS